MSKQEIIDKYLGKALVKASSFIIATIALFTGNITGTEWIIISTAYIAITGYTDTVLRLKDKM
jgi:hypothetical protein